MHYVTFSKKLLRRVDRQKIRGEQIPVVSALENCHQNPPFNQAILKTKNKRVLSFNNHAGQIVNRCPRPQTGAYLF